MFNKYVNLYLCKYIFFMILSRGLIIFILYNLYIELDFKSKNN